MPPPGIPGSAALEGLKTYEIPSKTNRSGPTETVWPEYVVWAPDGSVVEPIMRPLAELRIAYEMPSTTTVFEPAETMWPE